MKHLKLFLLITITFIVVSCNSKKEPNPLKNNYERIKVKGIYAMDVPKFMEIAKNLNKDATLEYQNLEKEMYAIVIGESKKEIIDKFTKLNQYNHKKSVAENYQKIQMNDIKTKAKLLNVSTPENLDLNGLDAQYVEADAKVPNFKKFISYDFAFVEGNKNVYMIMCWTLKDRAHEHQKHFKAMIDSFHEL